MNKLDPLTAVKRFGFGAKPGELKRIWSDPRSYIASQVAADRNKALITGPAFKPTDELLRLELQTRMLKLQLKQADTASAATPNKMPAPADGSMMQGGQGGNVMAAGQMPSAADAAVREVLREEIAARFERGATTDLAFVERLVVFWSNHFCVSAAKGRVRAVAGSFEREAIRPHIFGHFSEMLLAVTRHPAMLAYLDNAQSLGPGSRIGMRRRRGLNENLAREILELHTLGVDGGYTQRDVTNLARIITGWTIVNPRAGQPAGGEFVFNPQMHEPGEWPLLGKSFGNNGVKAGEDALLMLAHHPSTARNVATRLARHFVSDEPPQSLVDKLATTFKQTDGNLREMARTLVAAPEAWDAPASKIVPPYDFLVSVLRGFHLTPPVGEIVRFANALGQPVWAPPSPKGWPDANYAWLSSSGLNERLRVAEKVADFIDPEADPRDLAVNLLGPGLSGATRQAIDFAEGREQGLQLLIMSPEFLRR